MAKKAFVKKEKEIEDDFDFLDDFISPGDDAIAGVMGGFLEASNNQITHAIELTKLIVEKNASKEMSEDTILVLFRKACDTINERSLAKTLLEKLS